MDEVSPAARIDILFNHNPDTAAEKWMGHGNARAIADAVDLGLVLQSAEILTCTKDLLGG